MIDGDADDFDTIFGMFALQMLQQRDLAPAGLAPGRPEIDHQELSAEALERRRRAVEGRQDDRGQHLGDLAGRCAGRRGELCGRGGCGHRVQPRPLGTRRVVDEETARRAQRHEARCEQGAGEASRRRCGGAHEVGLTAARVRAAKASAFM